MGRGPGTSLVSKTVRVGFDSPATCCGFGSSVVEHLSIFRSLARSRAAERLFPLKEMVAGSSPARSPHVVRAPVARCACTSLRDGRTRPRRSQVRPEAAFAPLVQQENTGLTCRRRPCDSVRGYSRSAQVDGTGIHAALRKRCPKRACGFESRPEHSLRSHSASRFARSGAPRQACLVRSVSSPALRTTTVNGSAGQLEWPPVCQAGDRGFKSRRSRCAPPPRIRVVRCFPTRRARGQWSKSRRSRRSNEPPRVERGPAVRRLVQAVRSCPVVPR